MAQLEIAPKKIILDPRPGNAFCCVKYTDRMNTRRHNPFFYKRKTTLFKSIPPKPDITVE
jgi:hypothetical protein